MSAIDLNVVNKLLENLLNSLKIVQAALLFDIKGNLITSMMNDSLNAEEIGGTTSLIMFISDKIKIEFETGLFQNSSLQSENRAFVFRQIDNYILAFICDLNADLMIVSPYTKFVANKFLKILRGVEVDTTVPKLKDEIVKETRKAANEYAFKILILGNAGVGKTTTTVRFAHSLFVSEYKATLGVNIIRNEYWIDDNVVHFQIWDLAGQDRWAALRRIYYSGAQGALLLFDTTRKDSFNDLNKWHKEITTYTINLPVILVGNKMDLVDLRKVSTDEVKEKAKEFGYEYMETSAKTAQNIEEVFKILANKMING